MQSDNSTTLASACSDFLQWCAAQDLHDDDSRWATALTFLVLAFTGARPEDRQWLAVFERAAAAGRLPELYALWTQEAAA